MSEHRYSRRALLADYGRAAVGLALTAGPLLVINLEMKIAYGLAGLALLFFTYAVRTVLRERFSIQVDDEGLRGRGWRDTMVPWEGMRRVRLDYFSTRRDRGGGWMQLVIGGAGGTLRVDSGIAGFAEIARRTGAEGIRRGLALSLPTRANLASLGLTLPGEGNTGP
ncbi:MAG: hypothetical protein EXQ96_09960 [Alphaproteobacteria bacterium]|nr:hypothetical protein [Alphaproteobacteria bacterium]